MASAQEETSTKTVIVTGSSRGIGKAIAIRLAQDGFDVCINDIEASTHEITECVAEIQSLGRKAVGITADVGKRSEVERLVQESVSALGPLSVMVANAGIAQVKGVLDISEADVERMFTVNFCGVFNCYQVAAKQFIAQQAGTTTKTTTTGGGGKIIGAASIAAFRPFSLLSHYSASKWAVRGLTQAFAMEVARHSITVNAYAPGIVGTAMWDEIDEKMGQISGAAKGETLKQYSGGIPLGRVSVPEDVAKVVSFLAGEGSEYVTGQTWIVDGGLQFS
ncbi:MAG: hypothetical protein Q9191_006669 [Dirinaria sp. TL-2023a]